LLAQVPTRKIIIIAKESSHGPPSKCRKTATSTATIEAQVPGAKGKLPMPPPVARYEASMSSLLLTPVYELLLVIVNNSYV
jgi:hypothetical protein